MESRINDHQNGDAEEIDFVALANRPYRPCRAPVHIWK